MYSGRVVVATVASGHRAVAPPGDEARPSAASSPVRWWRPTRGPRPPHVIMTEPVRPATEGARSLGGSLDRLATPRAGPAYDAHEHHHHPRATRRPLRQRGPLPP